MFSTSLSNEALIALLSEKHDVTNKGICKFLSTFKISGAEFAEPDFVDSNFVLDSGILSEYEISPEELDQLRSVHAKLTSPSASSNNEPQREQPHQQEKQHEEHPSSTTATASYRIKAPGHDSPPDSVPDSQLVLHFYINRVSPFSTPEEMRRDVVTALADVGGANCIYQFEYAMTKAKHLDCGYLPFCSLDVIGRAAGEKVRSLHGTQLQPNHPFLVDVSECASFTSNAWSRIDDVQCCHCHGRGHLSGPRHTVEHCPVPPNAASLAGFAAARYKQQRDRLPAQNALTIKDVKHHSDAEIRAMCAKVIPGFEPGDLGRINVVPHSGNSSRTGREDPRFEGATWWIFMTLAKAEHALYLKRLQGQALDLFGDGFAARVESQRLKDERPEARDRHFGEMGCFECGEEGHFAKDCPNKDRVRGGASGVGGRRHDRDEGRGSAGGYNDGYGAPRGGGGYGDDRRRDYGGGYDDRRVAPPPRDDYRGGGGYRDDYNRESPRGGGYDDRRAPLPPPPRDDYRAGGGSGYDDRRAPPPPRDDYRGGDGYRDDYNRAPPHGRDGGGGGRGCFTCGSLDHLARACPRKDAPGGLRGEGAPDRTADYTQYSRDFDSRRDGYDDYRGGGYDERRGDGRY